MMKRVFVLLLLTTCCAICRAFEPVASATMLESSKSAEKTDDSTNLDGFISSPNRWNALDFGVVAGDETVDNTAALQRALDAAGAAGGGVVELPSGRFRFDGTLIVPTGTTLQGTYRVAPSVVSKDEKPTGTTLLTFANRGKPDAAPFIELRGSNCALAGVAVVYPEWKQTDVPPVPYPPCVASENSTAVAVFDCCLLNPYEGIHFHLAHRHLVRNVTGYPSYRGFYVDECYDIGRVENVHFWPFGVVYQPEDPYCKWINVNGIAFEFARTDWHYVANTFCFGYGRGYYFSDRGNGGANGNFLGIGADSCRRAVYVEQSQKQGLLITNGEFVGRWASEDSICLEIAEDNEGAVILTNCAFWGPVQTCVLSRQKNSRITLNACNFVNWDEVHSAKAKNGAPAIRIEAGKACVQGCSFEQAGTHLAIGEGATNVVATGNQAFGGFRVVGAKSPTRLQLAANELDPMEIEIGAKENYRFEIGGPGDARFATGWFAPEKNGAGKTFRWSFGESRLTLPVVSGKKYAIEIDLDAPAESIAENDKTVEILEDVEIGVFCRGEKVGEIVRGANRIAFEIESGDATELELSVRCRAWVPAEIRDGSDDGRTLGVCASEVRVRAVETDVEKTFDANAGIWIEE